MRPALQQRFRCPADCPVGRGAGPPGGRMCNILRYGPIAHQIVVRRRDRHQLALPLGASPWADLPSWGETGARPSLYYGKRKTYLPPMDSKQTDAEVKI